MRYMPSLSVFLMTFPVSAAASGEAVYEKHCAPCHSKGDVNVP